MSNHATSLARRRKRELVCSHRLSTWNCRAGPWAYTSCWCCSVPTATHRCSGCTTSRIEGRCLQHHPFKQSKEFQSIGIYLRAYVFKFVNNKLPAVCLASIWISFQMTHWTLLPFLSAMPFLRRDAMLARYMLSTCVCVCQPVCLSVTSRFPTKTAKPRITQTTPYDSRRGRQIEVG